MAKRKSVVKDTRPSLEEVKAKPGKYVVAEYRGYEQGGFIVPAPEPRFLGDAPKDLEIIAWVPRTIQDYWLDDPRLEELYQLDRGIQIYRTNLIPKQSDLLELPKELEKVTSYRKQMAWRVATSKFDEPMKEMIGVENKDSDEQRRVTELKYDIKPFLQACLIYEQRLGNRPEVVKAIKARVAEIDKMQAFDVKGF